MRERRMAESGDGIEFECLRCSKKVAHNDLMAMPELKCPNCGYKILKKSRPPVVKHLKAV